MELCIDHNELKKAVSKIKKAEKNGFYCCLAIFKITHAGSMLHDCTAEFNGIIEMASAVNDKLNWGRGQGITERYKFKDGTLIPINTP